MDDTPVSIFGKTSQDKVKHCLEMLKELEGTSLSGKTGNFVKNRPTIDQVSMLLIIYQRD
jgi:hypothetical protein